MKNALTKALVVSSVAGLGLLATTNAQAAITPGSSLSFSGASSTTLNENFATPMTKSVDMATGSFSGADSYSFSPATFTFTPDGIPFFTTFTSNSFDFTVIGGDAGGTVITFSTGEYFKGELAGTTFFSPITGFSGDDGTIKYSGVISFDQSGFGDWAAASYSGSFTAVPEPLTMLGAAAAVAFGGAFKRNAAKKQDKDQA